MADFQIDTEANPSQPSSGSAVVFVNSTNKELQTADDANVIKCIRPLTNTGSTTTAGADIYIVGSAITVPPQLVKVGSTFRWRLNASKTAACTSAPIYNIRVGTTGTVGSDTARLIFTQASAQTAATDNAVIDIFCVVTAIGSGTSGVINGGTNRLVWFRHDSRQLDFRIVDQSREHRCQRGVDDSVLRGRFEPVG